MNEFFSEHIFCMHLLKFAPYCVMIVLPIIMCMENYYFSNDGRAFAIVFSVHSVKYLVY